MLNKTPRHASSEMLSCRGLRANSVWYKEVRLMRTAVPVLVTLQSSLSAQAVAASNVVCFCSVVLLGTTPKRYTNVTRSPCSSEVPPLGSFREGANKIEA